MSQQARERWIHQVVNYTQQWDLQLCTSTSEHRESTQHPPVLLSPQLLEVGKSLNFKGSHFHRLRFCSLPLVTERLMRPDKNITLTSHKGVPSWGCNSMILKLFQLFIQTKSGNISNLKIPFMLCRTIYIYTHIFP